MSGIHTNISFATNQALSFSVDVNPDGGNAAISLVASPNPPSINTNASITPTAVQYVIGGNAKLVTYPNDGAFHRYSFVVGEGLAMWFRDGGQEYSVSFSPPAALWLDLRDLSGGGAGGRFDNVYVSGP